jgi:transposase
MVQNFLKAGDNREVLYFDEGRFGLKTETGKQWGKRGETLHTRVSQSYQNFCTYSAVSPVSGLSFSLFLPWVNTDMMNVYLAELSKAHPGKEMLIIWDGAGWHHSHDLEIPANIQVHFLPPYSPEPNPVERLWRWLRRHVTRNRIFDSNECLMNAMEQALKKMSPAQLALLCHCSYLHYIN